MCGSRAQGHCLPQVADDEEDEDEDAMVEFARLALQLDNPFAVDWSLRDEDLKKAVAWVVQRTPAEVHSCLLLTGLVSMTLHSVQVNAEREKIISQIEAWAAEFRASGECEAWFQGADEGVRKVFLLLS